SSRRRHTRFSRDWSSDVCSSDLLSQVRELAKAQNLGSAVMIFLPQPREFFAPATAPARLTNLAEKQALLAEYGIETLIVASFDRSEERRVGKEWRVGRAS